MIMDSFEEQEKVKGHLIYLGLAKEEFINVACYYFGEAWQYLHRKRWRPKKEDTPECKICIPEYLLRLYILGFAVEGMGAPGLT